MLKQTNTPLNTPIGTKHLCNCKGQTPLYGIITRISICNVMLTSFVNKDSRWQNKGKLIPFFTVSFFHNLWKVFWCITKQRQQYSARGEYLQLPTVIFLQVKHLVQFEEPLKI